MRSRQRRFAQTHFPCREENGTALPFHSRLTRSSLIQHASAQSSLIQHASAQSSLIQHASAQYFSLDTKLHYPPGQENMTETLNFGPEWLRALSSGGSVTSPPPSPAMPKYKLAEYRYGREEMLALYVEDNKDMDDSELFLKKAGGALTHNPEGHGRQSALLKEGTSR
ncbi:hypothetical protein SKAU_G00274000 [Synaphobranchus kaupii]|uniref:Uncharacterized protein n=1 Tax=Synaphobranchus kaupii TaxID=118154 RepID=A0A9Q1IQV9_SYNKA|nr:hypothetical protein SKAU_G00274000 [Synaphobranchus kaupii]